MLIINRRKGEAIEISDEEGNCVTLFVSKITPSKVVLKFTSSLKIKIRRAEGCTMEDSK